MRLCEFCYKIQDLFNRSTKTVVALTRPIPMLTVFLTFDSAVAFFAKFHNCIGLGFIHGSLKMVSSDKQFDNPAATKRMADLVNHLSIEEQRILARLLNDWEKRDQRLHPRIPCAIVTEYRASSRSYKDTIKNISLGGAFIESKNGLPVNLEINQRFFFPNFEIPIRSNSKIVWTAPIGFGVQFEIVEDQE